MQLPFLVVEKWNNYAKLVFVVVQNVIHNVIMKLGMENGQSKNEMNQICGNMNVNCLKRLNKITYPI